MRTRFAFMGVLLLALASGAQPAHAQDTSDLRTWNTQKSAGEVTLDVTPEWTLKGMTLKLSANTHSVELGEVNLREAVRLYVGDVAYTPAQAGSLGGHHGQASVLFAMSEVPTAFRVEIRDVPDVPLRVLKWPKDAGGR